MDTLTSRAKPATDSVAANPRSNPGNRASQPRYFANSISHILAELQRLDVLIQSQVRRSRQLHKTDEQFQGLFISDKEVDELLRAPLGSPRFLAAADTVDASETQAAFERMGLEIGQCVAESLRRGIPLRLVEAARHFQLAPFDAGCLLVCLAPEIDPRYERFYAYIQDDVTRKRPSVEFVLNLLCPTLQSKLDARARFSRQSPLQYWKLIHWIEDPSHPHSTLPDRFLRLDERIAEYLLGSDEIDSRILPWAEHKPTCAGLPVPFLPQEFRLRLEALSHRLTTHAEDSPDNTPAQYACDCGKPTGAILYFQGPSGIGKQEAARALSAQTGQGQLALDVEALATADAATFEDVIRRAARETCLLGATLYCRGFGALLPDEKRSFREKLLTELRSLGSSNPGVSGLGALSFIDGEVAWEPSAPAGSSFESARTPFIRIEFPRPAFAERSRMWAAALPAAVVMQEEIKQELEQIAAKFRLNGSQIGDAASTAASLALWRDPESAQITTEDLYASCRLHSNQKLSTLARKIKPRYSWDDIILPADKTRHLREICDSVKHRVIVYEKWGFDNKLSLGKGLNILFAGPPGTGKTMAAEIMAGELGLDLYKIDLSSLVSKYIGETEKNLAKIFSEAETSNAILFFDEADALFGKRSEVRDSHDRYANIEVGYLLQRMEEYEGVVILASNFRKNMDEAFVRRIHFTVEFPFPNESDRRRIWQSIWPKAAPLHSDVDLDLLAGRFELAGGSIKNIALAAAFLAAEDGGIVHMPHLLHATRREYQKMGKVVGHAEFE